MAEHCHQWFLMESQWSTSLMLLSDLGGGEATAWRPFLQLSTPLVAAWCRKAGLQEADAADNCQEVIEESVQGFLGSSLARTIVSAGGCKRSRGDVLRNTLIDVAIV